MGRLDSRCPDHAPADYAHLLITGVIVSSRLFRYAVAQRDGFVAAAETNHVGCEHPVPSTRPSLGGTDRDKTGITQCTSA